MSLQCPLIFRQVDATVIRINTFFVIGGVIAFLISGQVGVLVFLAADFMLRLYGYKHLSLIQNASLRIQQLFSLSPKMEDAGGKRLAAFFGLGFTVALGVAHTAEVSWLVNAIAAVYLSCAALELLFGLCIACKIYAFAKKIVPGAFS